MRNSGLRSVSDLPQRNIAIKALEFSSREQIIPALQQRILAGDGKTVVFAGHYMLVYRRTTNALVPLLGSIASADPAASDLEREYAAYVGDFPEASFDLGLQFLCASPAERRIALLVNDHHFKNFQDGLPPSHVLVRLKREYFRSGSALPPVFKDLLERAFPGGGFNDIFERNDVGRSAGGTLPSKTSFSSENVLRNRFEKLRKTWILTRPGFAWSGGIYGGMRLVYSPPRSGRSVCLLDNREGCGCSGAMIELLLQLWERGAKNLVLFIPEECRGPVAEALEATLRALAPFRTVIAVWSDGVGTDGKTLFMSGTQYTATE